MRRSRRPGWEIRDCGATVSSVTELVCMLVPLDAAPDPASWATTQPTWLDVLGLLIGVPAVVFIVIAVLTKSKQLIRAARGVRSADPSEPIWIGAAPPEAGMLTSGETAPVPAAGQQASAEDVGGASARW